MPAPSFEISVYYVTRGLVCIPRGVRYRKIANFITPLCYVVADFIQGFGYIPDNSRIEIFPIAD